MSTQLSARVLARALKDSTAFERRERASREHNSLAAAVLDLAGADPRSAEQFLADVNDEWGACDQDRLDAVLAELVVDRALVRRRGGYALAGGVR